MYVSICVPACVEVQHVNAGAHGLQKVLGHLELESQVTVS